jgi:hypothetical protein
MKYLKEFNSYIGVLYHGSNKKLDCLSPSPSKVINGENAVFATNRRWLALCFIAKFEDSDIELGYINGIPYIEELKENAFESLKVPGYIYTVPSNNFISDDRLGIQNMEFISTVETNIVETEEIDDVYKELKNTEVYMIPYDIVLMIHNQKSSIKRFNEMSTNFNYDYIIKALTKGQYGWGNSIKTMIDDFESCEDYSKPVSNDDYILQFDEYLTKIKIGKVTPNNDVIQGEPISWYAKST